MIILGMSRQMGIFLLVQLLHGYSFTGKRNLFYGTGVETCQNNSATVRELANKQLNPLRMETHSILISHKGQQFIIFAYPATLRDVNQVMYVETNDTGMASSFYKDAH